MKDCERLSEVGNSDEEQTNDKIKLAMPLRSAINQSKRPSNHPIVNIDGFRIMQIGSS